MNGIPVNKETDLHSELYVLFLEQGLRFQLIGDCLDGMLYTSSLS